MDTTILVGLATTTKKNQPQKCITNMNVVELLMEMKKKEDFIWLTNQQYSQ